MVSELATPLSADAMIDPAMDPFDRIILLCEKMLSMLDGRAKQLEDSGVDQELADSCVNATSSSDGAVPTKCSTMGVSPNAGDAEGGVAPLLPEESHADQELTDGCVKAISSSHGAVPTKFSTFGLSPNVGDAAGGFTSLHPEDSHADQKLATGCNNATGSPDGAVPAKCSTSGPSPYVGRVEGVDSSEQSWIVSKVNSGPVGAPLPSTMQQLGTLKPDTQMPATRSTGIDDTDIDAKSAKRDADTLQAGLSCTRVGVVPLPATAPPHPPDQHKLFLARPPPWPVWMASARLTTSPTIRYTHVIDRVFTSSANGLDDHTGWVSHGLVDWTESHVVGLVTKPWDPGQQLIMLWLYSCVCCQANILEWIWQRQSIDAIMVFSVSIALLVFEGSAVIPRTATMSLPTLTASSIQPSNMPMWSIEREQEQRHMLCLISPSACGQAEILGEVKRVYAAPFTVPPWLYSCVCCRMNIFEWTWLQQSNEATLVPYIPSAMPGGNSLDVSSFYKHDYADGQCTQFDFSEERTGLHHKLQFLLWCIQSRLLDMGQHTRPPPAYSWVLDGSVVIFSDCGDHPLALPGYNISCGQGACILKDSLILTVLQIVNNILKLPCVPGVQGFRAAEIFTISSVCPAILSYHVLAVSTGTYHGIFSWWQQYTSWLIVAVTIESDLRFRGECNGAIIGKGNMCSSCTLQAYSTGNVKLLPNGVAKVAYNHKLELHRGAMFVHLILWQLKLSVHFKTRTTSPTSLWSGSIGKIATSMASGPMVSWRYAEFYSPHSVLLVLIRDAHSTTEIMLPALSAADRIGSLFMLSVSVPWDPGVCNKLRAEQWIKLHMVQPICIPGALWPHLLKPLQQRHGAQMHELILRIECKTSPGEYASYRSVEHQGEMLTELIDLWEGRFCHLKLWFTYPTEKQLRHSPSCAYSRCCTSIVGSWMFLSSTGLGASRL